MEQTRMRVFVVLAGLIAVAGAYDCFGRNSSCVESHVKCDTGYEPFCEHLPGPHGQFFGICTCDKECQAAADCTNTQADGCPPHAHAMCDMQNHVCHCGPPHPHEQDNHTS